MGSDLCGLPNIRLYNSYGTGGEPLNMALLAMAVILLATFTGAALMTQPGEE
ncbi:MAG: hypothetical protein VYB27_00555 [Candidatus Thermoplasmatota archaeon]|nr:hypothetical protein [Candidatus Thermoplasmatota archaeon]